MASDSLLIFDELLAPIPGDNPAGDTPYAVKEQLKEDRKENADEDPPKRADWQAIIRLAQKTLQATSKDLQVAAHLTEALAQVHGFAGLRDGLHLQTLLVEQCWDRLNPPVVDGDLEIRASSFNWLDDPARGALFPSTVRMLPLVPTSKGRFSWQDWRLVQDGKGELPPADFEIAIRDAPLDKCQTIAQDLEQCQQELKALGSRLHERMGEAAPGLTALGQSLEDCGRLMQEILKLVKGPDEEPNPAESATGAPDGQGADAKPSGGRHLATRAEAYRQLAEAAALLQKLEPHSPIPYFIQRAVELGKLPYPQLIKALIREPNVLAELNREMGIKTEESS